MKYGLVALAVISLTGVAVELPRRNETRVFYYPFSWTSSGRLRKDGFTERTYEITSLLRSRSLDPLPLNELLRLSKVKGPACDKTIEDMRLLILDSKGRELWIDSDGCRQGDLAPQTHGTRLNPKDLDDLKRFLVSRMPPAESFSFR